MCKCVFIYPTFFIMCRSPLALHIRQGNRGWEKEGEAYERQDGDDHGHHVQSSFLGGSVGRSSVP